MRFFISRICVFCLCYFVLFGCSNKAEEVKILANDFLVAYFQADYKRAASMCTDSFSVEFLSSIEDIELLFMSENLKQELINEGSKVQINITEVRVGEDKDIMTVFYFLVLPESVEKVSKSIVVKREEGEWKITSL